MMLVRSRAVGAVRVAIGRKRKKKKRRGEKKRAMDERGGSAADCGVTVSETKRERDL